MPQGLNSFGLIGFPLEHSRSPAIHTAALAALGLPGEYRLYLIPPLPAGREELKLLLDRLREGEINGLNVTIPHKQAVLPFLDSLTSTAQTIVAANTLFMQDGRLIGDNTDAAGFMADLNRLAPGVFGSQKIALVLGAGGSASAIIYALLQAGQKVVITARRLEQALEIVERFSAGIQPPGSSRQASPDPNLAPSVEISAIGIESLPDLISEYASHIGLVVNTTPLGMAPHVQASPWPDDLPFPPKATVYDLVYNPIETRLVAQASRAGLLAFTGLGMLVEQAALSFERWTGQPAPRLAMFAAAARGL